MSQQDALVAARVRARRRNTGIAMGFGLLLCLAGAVWAFSTLGEVGDQAAVELVPETTLPSIPDPAATPVDGTTPPPADATTAPPAPAVPITRFVSPSGNIACAISEQFARCDVAEKSWDAGAAAGRLHPHLGAGRRRRRGGPGGRLRRPSRSSAAAAARSRTAATSRSATTPAPPARRACAAPRRAPGLGFSLSRRAYTFF